MKLSLLRGREDDLKRTRDDKKERNRSIVHKKVAILTGSLVTYHKDLVRNTKKTVSIQLRERRRAGRK